jgi:hypothetical protein
MGDDGRARPRQQITRFFMTPAFPVFSSFSPPILNWLSRKQLPNVGGNFLQTADAGRSASGHGLPLRLRRHHVQCTPDSCRLAATPKSAASGQFLPRPRRPDHDWSNLDSRKVRVVTFPADLLRFRRRVAIRQHLARRQYWRHRLPRAGQQVSPGLAGAAARAFARPSAAASHSQRDQSQAR